ncbi:MAG: hypothetical protein RLZZ511_2779 [Cyanobacteriota bacterium]
MGLDGFEGLVYGFGEFGVTLEDFEPEALAIEFGLEGFLDGEPGFENVFDGVDGGDVTAGGLAVEAGIGFEGLAELADDGGGEFAFLSPGGEVVMLTDLLDQFVDQGGVAIGHEVPEELAGGGRGNEAALDGDLTHGKNIARNINIVQIYLFGSWFGTVSD